MGVGSNGGLPIKVRITASVQTVHSSHSTGISLLNLAAQEDSGRPRSRRNSGPSLSRQLYIHGLTYLLRGLPSNLSPEEKFGVYSALPADVLELSADMSSTDIIRVGDTRLANQQEPEPSLLHRALAALVVRLFIIFQFFLPYIKVFFAAAYRYERQHRISERVFSSSIDTVERVMKSSMEFGNAVCQINDGKVGQAINDATVWWVRGVTGGLHQGVGEGLVILGVDSAGKQKGGKRVN
jgi:hypothetical protein